ANLCAACAGRGAGREPVRPPPPRRSHPPQMPAPRKMPPRRARTTAQKRTFFETKWRQIPPHTGQLRARTLLLLNACPTSISTRAVSPFSAASIALLLLRARPVPTVTQGSAASCEIRDRRSVQRRGCSQRHGLRKLELGSAQQRLISAP